MQLRIPLSLLFLALTGTDIRAAELDTLRIYFAFNDSKLNEQAQRRIDSSFLAGMLRSRQDIRLIAYADKPGQNDYNLHLSEQRAAEVRNYLVSSGIRAADIRHSIAYGESRARPTDDPEGVPEDRRVDIVVQRKAPHKTVRPVPEVEKPVFRPMKKADTAIATGALTIQPGQVGKPASKAGFGDLRKGELITLDNIYFYPGRHIVRPESYAALDRLYLALAQQESVQIHIEGHVCCIPKTEQDAYDEDSHNVDLSWNRAESIRQYLLKKGIAASRMKSYGYGHRYPVVDPERNENDANRNRRVEIRVVNK